MFPQELLLSRGADPNIRGENWPVCMAVKQPEILKRLLPALAEPRAFKGVMEMAVVANQIESIKLLLRAGVSVEDRNGGVFSPLTTAIRENRKDIVRFLLVCFPPPHPHLFPSLYLQKGTYDMI